MKPPLPTPLPRPPHSPWQLLYQAAHALRRRWYRNRARRLPVPVLSVGNLHWGGTGKTPVVAAIAAFLRDRGWRVAILSRGYPSHGRGVRVVSSGDGPLLGPGLAGDEPVLLAGELPGVAVVVGRDRYRAGRQALERLDPAPELLVLDDGFSHLRLAREVDILSFPVSDPLGGGRLPPSGRLREPLTAVARAHALLLSGSGADSLQARQLAEVLRAWGFGGPGFACPLRPRPARYDDHTPLAAGCKVLVVSGIARPPTFLENVHRAGFEVAGELHFADHHTYPEASLRRIETAWRGSGAEAVLTTAKDRVKLSGRIQAPLAELPLQAEPEPAFWTWLEASLEHP